MDWKLAYHELLIRLKQWRRIFEIWIHWQTAEAISLTEVFKYPLAGIPCSCGYFLSCAELVVLKSALLLWSTILYFNSSLRLTWVSQNSHLRYLRWKKSVYFNLGNHTRYVIPCGNQGFLTFYSNSWALILWQKEFYLTIYALNTLIQNTWSDTSLYAELVRLFHAKTLLVTFFASTSTAAQ